MLAQTVGTEHLQWVTVLRIAYLNALVLYLLLSLSSLRIHAVCALHEYSRGLQKHNELVTIPKAVIFAITKHGQKRRKF